MDKGPTEMKLCVGVSSGTDAIFLIRPSEMKLCDSCHHHLKNHNRHGCRKCKCGIFVKDKSDDIR